MPKIRQCRQFEKVGAPKWCRLDEPVSFILSGRDSGEGKLEALLSFWGEPFMAKSTQRDVPRYIFLVPGHSELLPRLAEMERHFRMVGDDDGSIDGSNGSERQPTAGGHS